MRRVLACLFIGGLWAGALFPHLPAAAQQHPPQAVAAPGKHEPARLGIELQDLTKPSIDALGLTQAHAVLVTFPTPGGPADRAGLEPGDVIVELEGAAVGSASEVAATIQGLGAADQPVTLGLLRDSERLTVQATLAGPMAWTTASPDEQAMGEQRIAAYEGVVVRFKGGAFARDLAPVQRRLGNAYAERDKGDRARNLDQALAAYEAALKTLPPEWTKTPLLLWGPDTRRILGGKFNGHEMAVAQYEVALTSFTREAVPFKWGEVQRFIGPSYLAPSYGDAAENIETAIAAYQAALAATAPETRPRAWAGMQYTLADLYTIRKRGEQIHNVEKAVAAYEQALTVTAPEAQPREWVGTHVQLAEKHGSLYKARTNAAEASNGIETTLRHAEAALSVSTREAMAYEWGMAHSHRANAYSDRLLGDRADNIERAIASNEASLTVITREANADFWGHITNNLAIAYTNRLRGDPADNLEKAIAAFEASLTARTGKFDGPMWALTQANLATAYLERVRGDRGDNLEQAITASEAALTVHTREARPDIWANIQNNLGLAYKSRVRGDRADNLEKAIDAYEGSLAATKRESRPAPWALAQHNLAEAYRDRVRGDRADNLRKAIAASEAALSVMTNGGMTANHIAAARSLGRTLIETRDWRKASLAYANAREVYAQLFGEGLNPAMARKLVDFAGPLFAEAAFVAAQRGQPKTALALASEGRARLMAVAMKLQVLDLPADKRWRLDELRADIRAGERLIEATAGVERAAALEQVGTLRQELLGLVKEADAADATGPASAFALARGLAGKRGAVLVPIVTEVGGKILIVTNAVRSVAPDAAAPSKDEAEPWEDGATPWEDGVKPWEHEAKPSKDEAKGASAPKGRTSSAGPTIAVLDLPQLTTGRLNLLMRGDGSADSAGGWLDAYKINYLSGSELQRRWPEWIAAVDRLGPELWRLFGAQLDAALRRHGIESGARLVWMPTGALGVLPVGLAQSPAGKRRLADSYEIVYAPSLDAIASARAQIGKAPPPPVLTAVVNPTGDLPAAEQEGMLVASYFHPKERTVLSRAEATPAAVLAALKGKSYWHFASHGTFSWKDARQSGLLMHAKEPLSVGDLQEADGLGRPRLVVLSACETGLHDIGRNPDEFIGLPGTFTALGAAGVLGTLWPVSDTATALLIARFYDLHMGAKLTPPTALRRAQLWLRQASNADLAAYTRTAARQGRLDPRQAAAIQEELSEPSLRRSRNAALVEWIAADPARPADTPASSVVPPNVPTAGKTARGESRLARPYAHPYYWAGFIYTGL